ncbi:MAG: GGDEF domain-containing protein [Chromatiales bacterium]|nr:GGDEF domain-containing protein [Chromatiales bacterium]
MATTSSNVISDLNAYFPARGPITMSANQNLADTVEPRADSRLLEITQRLTTTLDLESLIQVFFSEIAQDVDHDGMRYHNQEARIELQVGEDAVHSAHYELRVNQQDLGMITFLRRRPFNGTELKELEDLLCGLFYPLRNALMYREALRSAYVDPLTGANNRAALEMVIRRDRLLAQRQTQPLSVIMLDVDHFKQINDRYGHACGDLALRTVAQVTTGQIRGSDQLFRYGGEEFLLLLSNTAQGGAKHVAERIRIALQDANIPWEGRNLHLTASFGVASLRAGDDSTALFKRADEALYRAKRAGRNQVMGEL